jgi:5-methylcytosine-specific restriction endonuclease McrA
MQKHVRNYLDYFNYSPEEIILCEVCGKRGVDLHHIIYRSQGGSDDVDNIICLSRDCHTKAHNNELTKEYLKEIHNKNL